MFTAPSGTLHLEVLKSGGLFCGPVAYAGGGGGVMWSLGAEAGAQQKTPIGNYSYRFMATVKFGNLHSF